MPFYFREAYYMLNLFVIKNLLQSIWSKVQVTKMLSSDELLLDNSIDKVVIKIKVNKGSNSIQNEKDTRSIQECKKADNVAQGVLDNEKDLDLKIFKVINQENRIILVAEKNKVLAMKQAVDAGHGDKMSGLSAKDITKGFLAKKDSVMPSRRGII